MNRYNSIRKTIESFFFYLKYINFRCIIIKCDNIRDFLCVINYKYIDKKYIESIYIALCRIDNIAIIIYRCVIYYSTRSSLDFIRCKREEEKEYIRNTSLRY